MICRIFWICVLAAICASSAELMANVPAGAERTTPTPADTLAKITAPSKALKPDLESVLMLDFFTTFNAVRYDNQTMPDQVPQLNVYYNLNLDNQLRSRFFALRTILFNEYGFRHYFDSVTVKTDDNLRLRNTIQVKLYRELSIQAGTDFNTQCWKKWLPEEDTSLGRSRYLFSDYQSPGYVVYSMGVGLNFLKGGTLNLGLVGGKVTRIRNQNIFEERGAETLYGLKKGERKKAEWGISLNSAIPAQKLGSHFFWEFNSSLFIPGATSGFAKTYTGDAMAALYYVFLKYMRLSLRTDLKYDEQVQSKLFMVQRFSIGFYLSNKL
jgi:hypothetical protein